MGRLAAEDSTDEVVEVLRGVDTVFLVYGLCGGTGTGAAPVIANLAGRLKAQTAVVVSRPFMFEGEYRRKIAKQGLETVQDAVNYVFAISCDRVFRWLEKDQLPVERAFALTAKALAWQVLARLS